jgi:hypothetical protein
MAWVLGHRQTKGAATDIPDLPSPRHTSTLPIAPPNGRFYEGICQGPREFRMFQWFIESSLSLR